MFRPNQHIHFIGIGGVGMAGIAEVLLNLTYGVSGSDLRPNGLTDNLEARGAKVFFGHRAENVPAETTVVVVSSAVNEKNVEVIEARQRSLPVIPRAEMLAELMRMKYGIAIGGAHGKTTTTTMVSRVIASLDPTVIIGGRVLSQASGARLGAGPYLVAEADESDGSFNLLRPAIAVVTNIDSEHLNHYGSFERLERAFFDFMSSVPFYGAIVGCFDDSVVRRLASEGKRRVVSYGLNFESDVMARDVEVEERGSSFTVCVRGSSARRSAHSTEQVRVSLPIPGEHMVSNALAAAAVGLELGVSLEQIAAALSSFPGVARRSEILGRVGGITVVDDYGHHPTEVAATLRGLRRSYAKGGRLLVVFQPHRYTRTRDLFNEFCGCFNDADQVFLTEIYSAGEEPIPEVSGAKLAEGVRHRGVNFVGDLSEAAERCASVAESGDVIVTLGAGSVGTLGPKILELLQLSLERRGVVEPSSPWSDTSAIQIPRLDI